MNELNPQYEALIQNFKTELEATATPCDMFPEMCPPDFGGVREPRRPIMPFLTGAIALELAPVYDLERSRQRRERVVQHAALFMDKTAELALV